MAIPGPRRMPLLWQIAIVGDYALPPIENRGACEVRVTPSLKKDDKKKPGKDKASTSVERIEPAKIEIVLRFNEEIWEQVEPVIRGLKPDGKPRDLMHPSAQMYDISAILIEQASPLEWNDGIGEITWSGEGWTAPAAQGQPLILRRGSQGPEVSRWQQFLTEQKFGEAEGFSPVDGIFGPETFGAASKYGYVPPPPVQGGAGSGGGVQTPQEAQAAALLDAAGDVADAVADAAGDVADAAADAVDTFLGGDDGENAGAAGAAGGQQ